MAQPKPGPLSQFLGGRQQLSNRFAIGPRRVVEGGAVAGLSAETFDSDTRSVLRVHSINRLGDLILLQDQGLGWPSAGNWLSAWAAASAWKVRRGRVRASGLPRCSPDREAPGAKSIPATVWSRRGRSS